MAGTSFNDVYNKLKKIDSVCGVKTVQKKIPIGKKDGVVCYRNRQTVKLCIDFSKDVSWLDELDSNLLVQIGDTFYKKSGTAFKYDYLNSSSDYDGHGMDDKVDEGDVYIMINNGLDDETC